MPPKQIITIGQLELRFLLDGNDTSNDLVMFEFIIPPEAKVPVPHYHQDVDEVLYGLEGVSTTMIAGKKTELHPGDRLYIPRGVVHHHDNLTDQPAKTLVVLTPASIGPAYFQEMSELIRPGIPPDPQKAREIMLRHGLMPVAP